MQIEISLYCNICKVFLTTLIFGFIANTKLHVANNSE